MRRDSYLFTVAATMNVQLIVALLIANVVVANAQYLPRPCGGRNELSKLCLNNPNTGSTNLKLHRFNVPRDGSRKVNV